MSNVRISATGETGIIVEVTLGANVRKTHEVAGGNFVDLTVAGNQKLTVSAAADVAPTAEAENLPVGADVDEAQSSAGNGKPTEGGGTESELEGGKEANVQVDINELAADSPLAVGEIPIANNPFGEGQ